MELVRYICKIKTHGFVPSTHFKGELNTISKFGDFLSHNTNEKCFILIPLKSKET
jgi:hypothetical protein